MKTTVDLTNNEMIVVAALIELLYAEPGFSDAGVDELADSTGKTKASIKGTVGSLTKKGVFDEEPEDFPGIVYLNDKFWSYHPEWHTQCDSRNQYTLTVDGKPVKKVPVVENKNDTPAKPEVLIPETMKKERWMTAPVPEQTKSYTPVAHKDLIEFVDERLDAAGFKRTSLKVDDAKDGKIIVANMGIEREGNFPFHQQFSLINSYNKSKPVTFASGAEVFVCANGMIISEAVTVRRHTTNVWNEMATKADEAIAQLNANWERTLDEVTVMQEFEMTRTQMAEVAGRLYFEKHVLSHTEASVVARELRKPTFEDFSALTLWSLYNACTYALRQTHAYRKNESLKSLHDFCLELV